MLKGLARKVQKQDGFTLIELIVVVAILGILAAVVTPRVLNALSDAKEKSALAFGKQVQLAMERYYVDNASYPQVDDDELNNATDGLGALLSTYLNVEANKLYAIEYNLIDEDGDGNDDSYELIIDVNAGEGEERLVTITPRWVETGD